MPDFSALLRPPVEVTKRPPPLPNEIYPGVIKSYEYGENSNKTPYVRFNIGLTGWPPNLDDSKKTVTYDDGTEIIIDPEKRDLRRDYFLTSAAYFRLTDLLESLNITVQVVDGQLDLETAVPKTVGCRVGVEVQQYMSQRTGEVGNNVGQLFPLR